MGKNFRRTTAQTAVLMAVLTLLAKFFGFLREMVLAGFFGTNYVVDAYVMSSTILITLFGGIIIAISTSYMPIFSKISETEGNKAGNIFTSKIINLLVVISLLIAFLGFVFSDQIVIIFASGFSGETASLTSDFIKILSWYITFSAVAAILEPYLQYKGIFIPQIISGYFVSICMMIFIVISVYTNYYFLAFGTLIGYALRCFAIVGVAKTKNYKHYFNLNFGPSSKELFSLAIPVFIGSYITYINLFIDKTLASNLVEGSIAALNYASLINNMIIAVTITILSTIIYPKLTQANALQQSERFNTIVSSGFNIVLIIGIPCSLGAVLYSNEIIQIIYKRGAFDESATIMTSTAFSFYASGMVFMAINEFITRIYYSKHETKLPMIFGAIGVIINIVLNLILVRYMEHNGLALATSIAAVCNTTLLISGLRKKFCNIRLIESYLKIVKIICAAILSITISYIIHSVIILFLSNLLYAKILQMLVIVLTASLTYLGLLFLFKVEEVNFIKNIWR